MRTPYLAAVLVTLVGSWLLVVSDPITPHETPSAIPQPDPRILHDQVPADHDPYSNILPEDYVGPDACGGCHPKQFRNWQNHPHRCMNQLPDDQSVKADFQGAVLSLPAGTARFVRSNDGHFQMAVSRDNQPFRRYQVTRTVGSRSLQFFVGRQLEGPEPSDNPIYQEHMLPFAYWFKLGRWFPREYLDPNGPEQLVDGMPQFEALNREPDVRPYTRVCMNCHNTLPYAYRIFHHNLAGFLGATIAARIQPLSHALQGTVDVEPTVAGFQELNALLDPDQHLVTLGISCESCHFGGREHVKHQRKIRFLPSSPLIEVQSHDTEQPVTDDPHNARTVLGICVQCHSGTGDFHANGASTANSREAIDMHLGACASQLRCVDCHEPHTAGHYDPHVDAPQHVDVCLRCHQQYADPEKAAAHSGHPASAGINCLDCHMPRYAQGLDRVVRTHRICRPVEPEMVETRSVNACNLCHLDKSLSWTVRQVEAIWGSRLPLKPETRTGHDLRRPAGRLWLQHRDPAVRIVATLSYARSPLGIRHFRALSKGLNDPQPINRVFATLALAELFGRDPKQFMPVDVTAPPAERERQLEQWLADQMASPALFSIPQTVGP